MLDISARLGTFDEAIHPDTMASLIWNWVYALMMVDVAYLQANPRTPLLYESGVFYKEEPMGLEDFLDIPEVINQGHADCEDLAAWRGAEWIANGYSAIPLVSWEALEHRNGDLEILFHVQVQTPYGVEDPSVVLGMGSTWGNRLVG